MSLNIVSRIIRGAMLCATLPFAISNAFGQSQPNINLESSLLKQSMGSGSGSGSGSSRSYRGLMGFEDRSEIGSLESDLEPYVGDGPIVDSLYRVGPGDVFQIHVETSSLERQVGPEGGITLNRIGTVQLEGLTLKEAKAKLLNKLASGYRRSDCFVGLSRPKTMRVFVTGAVSAPGALEVSGNARLTDAVKAAGGYAASAQKGEITVTLNGRTTKADLQKFYVMGDLGANPYLEQGALIHVPFIDYSKPWVSVRRDGQTFSVQTESEASLSELVLKSYSFAPPAPYTAVLVREKSGRDSLIPARDATNYRPGNGAFIEVIPARQEIFVAGAVAGPGLQPHVADRRIIQYISSAGLLTSSKIPRKIEVIRADGKRIFLPIQSNALQPGDVLYVRQNVEQKFLIYTPILLSFVSLSLAVITVFGLN